jgi:hypothetical protein
LFHESVEQHEDSVAKVILTLELQRPPEDVPLEQNLEEEDAVSKLQQLCGVSLLEPIRNPDERFRKRMLTDVIQEPEVVV